MSMRSAGRSGHGATHACAAEALCTHLEGCVHASCKAGGQCGEGCRTHVKLEGGTRARQLLLRASCTQPACFLRASGAMHTLQVRSAPPHSSPCTRNLTQNCCIRAHTQSLATAPPPPLPPSPTLNSQPKRGGSALSGGHTHTHTHTHRRWDSPPRRDLRAFPCTPA